MDDRQSQPPKASSASAHVTFFAFFAFIGGVTLVMSGINPLDAFGWSLAFVAVHGLSIGLASTPGKERPCTPTR